MKEVTVRLNQKLMEIPWYFWIQLDNFRTCFELPPSAVVSTVRCILLLSLLGEDRGELL